MMIIDFHSHFVPEVIVKQRLAGKARSTVYVRGVPAQTMNTRLGDFPARLQAMEVARIDAAVITAPLPEVTLEDCRLINDDLHRIEKAHPGRIYPLAHVPPTGGAEALRELERCATTLGFKGVLLWSDVGGEPLDARALWPFYAEVERLGLFIFIHPALLPIGAEYMAEHDLARAVGREFGLILATYRLIAGGVLDAFPSIKICLSHCAGGALPLVGRVRGYFDRDAMGTVGDPKQGTKTARPLEEYLKELYYDTGGFFGDLTAIEAALLTVPPSQILFGTDYPQELRTGEEKRDFIRAIESMALPPADREAILWKNAAMLLKL